MSTSCESSAKAYSRLWTTRFAELSRRFTLPTRTGSAASGTNPLNTCSTITEPLSWSRKKIYFHLNRNSLRTSVPSSPCSPQGCTACESTGNAPEGTSELTKNKRQMETASLAVPATPTVIHRNALTKRRRKQRANSRKNLECRRQRGKQARLMTDKEKAKTRRSKKKVPPGHIKRSVKSSIRPDPQQAEMYRRWFGIKRVAYNLAKDYVDLTGERDWQLIRDYFVVKSNLPRDIVQEIPWFYNEDEDGNTVNFCPAQIKYEAVHDLCCDMKVAEASRDVVCGDPRDFQIHYKSAKDNNPEWLKITDHVTLKYENPGRYTLCIPYFKRKHHPLANDPNSSDSCHGDENQVTVAKNKRKKAWKKRGWTQQ